MEGTHVRLARIASDLLQQQIHAKGRALVHKVVLEGLDLRRQM